VIGKQLSAKPQAETQPGKGFGRLLIEAQNRDSSHEVG